ncbi:hypothetical protein SDC9_128847 [bioreactor metagenome]|uniref:Uncharacterized protein n=1 Tax=bioreactor metagenome TaxID=1076179 RepID=A0A645CX94_9ZZZZ
MQMQCFACILHNRLHRFLAIPLPLMIGINAVAQLRRPACPPDDMVQAHSSQNVERIFLCKKEQGQHATFQVQGNLLLTDVLQGGKRIITALVCYREGGERSTVSALIRQELPRCLEANHIAV